MCASPALSAQSRDGKALPIAREGRVLATWGQQLVDWGLHWWRLVFLGAQVLMITASPASWRVANPRRLAYELVQATAPGMRTFSVLMAVLGAVIIRVVLQAANSVGLAAMAPQVVMRVWLLELVPLAVALYVAVRYSVPGGNVLYRARMARQVGAGAIKLERRWLDAEVLPRVLAAMFAVSFLGLLSTWVALILLYLSVYGYNHWGLIPFTRAVGQVLSPVTSLVFTFKVALFSLIVAVWPVATALQDWRGAARTSVELQGLVRMLTLLLLVEALALIANYY